MLRNTAHEALPDCLVAHVVPIPDDWHPSLSATATKAGRIICPLSRQAKAKPLQELGVAGTYRTRTGRGKADGRLLRIIQYCIRFAEQGLEQSQSEGRQDLPRVAHEGCHLPVQSGMDLADGVCLCFLRQG